MLLCLAPRGVRIFVSPFFFVPLSLIAWFVCLLFVLPCFAAVGLLCLVLLCCLFPAFSFEFLTCEKLKFRFCFYLLCCFCKVALVALPCVLFVLFVCLCL